MRTVHTVAELRAALAGVDSDLLARKTIALVPTMGNLHEGHLDLIRSAKTQRLANRKMVDQVVASIFVNPLQFGANEDFGLYPRSLADDQEKLAAAGCDLLFAPSVHAMYPHGLPLSTQVTVTGITETLEGSFRPGHFQGVATVVSLLFNLLQPELAMFGQKDWQQLVVIRRMVRDLQMPVTVIGVPTRRAADGLALSSRNQYLNPDERTTAAVIYATLRTIEHEILQGSRDYPGLELAGMQALAAHGLQPQYVAIRTPELQSAGNENKDLVILVAAHLGKTRLIDNLAVVIP